MLRSVFGKSVVLSLISCIGIGVGSRADEALPLGRATFADRRNPPSFLELDPQQRQSFELGHAIFNTHWTAAGTSGAQRIDGVGPVFNATACDSCHNNGARGQGPRGDGPVSGSLVIQLGGRSAHDDAIGEDAGDPRYGHVLNTTAAEGLYPEAVVMVRYRERSGSYRDGGHWALREPHYEVAELRHGALDRNTVIRPRLAPPLYGLGLLEAVPAEIVGAARGRFGWQASMPSIRAQTAVAFAREMGLTSHERPHDDCTAHQVDCLRLASGGEPEVSIEFVDALVDFQRWLAVPLAAHMPDGGTGGARLFDKAGCAACHRPDMPVKDELRGTIRAYTDLQLHDLGEALADRDVAGRTVQSRWRTPPLWGLGFPLRNGRQETYLHDGRARSIEEAILWHGGEARPARAAFERLNAPQRQELLDWLISL